MRPNMQYSPSKARGYNGGRWLKGNGDADLINKNMERRAKGSQTNYSFGKRFQKKAGSGVVTEK